jgi:putative aldouronate transport system substrate-binding protein
MMKALHKIGKMTVMIILVAAVIAGCSNNGNNVNNGNNTVPSTETESKSESKDQGSKDVKPAERVTLKIEVFDRGNAPEGLTVTDNEMIKYIQENFGDPNNIDVQYVPVPRSEEINQLNVMMAAGTAPDIIFTYDEGAVYEWSNQGGLTDLGDLIDQYGPNLKSYLSGSLPYGVFDGTQYAVVARRVNLQKYSSIIRQDWLDALNLKVPTTTEETYEVLKAFKKANLGGQRTIPFGFGLMPESYEPVIWSFIKEQSDEDRYLKSVTIGSGEYPVLADGHKDAMQFLNKLYNEGLLDPDFALDKDKKKKQENLVNGYLGMYSADNGTPYGDGDNSLVNQLMRNVPGADVTPLLPWTDFEGKNRQPSYAPSGMYITVPSFSKRSKEAIMYLDWMAQDEVIQYMAFGVEGKHHDLVNGYPVGNGSDDAKKLLFNSGDMLIVTNGIDFGSDEKNVEYYALTIGDNLRAEAIEARMMGLKDAVKQPIRFEKPLETQAKYSVVMKEKYEELLVRSVMAKSADFDKVYESGLQDFMATAGNEVFAERAQAYEAMK